MKNIVYTLMLAGLVSCSDADEKGFTVKGTLKNAGAGLVYLEETSDQGAPVILDSARLNDKGSFHLTTEPKEDKLYNLRLDNQRFPFVSLINDSEEITLDADFDKVENFYTVNGSAASQQLKDFVQTLSGKMNEIGNTNNEVMKLLETKDADSLLQAKRKELITKTTEMKQYVTNFVNNSKSASLTLFAMGTYQNLASNTNIGVQGWTNEEMSDLLAWASKKFPQNTSFSEIRKRYVPQAAPDFTMPDVNGKPVSLSSFRGKYVLVDFWASWCRPCREENPNVVNAYKKYRDRNFTVLGVSLDQEREPWLQAIKKDSLNWTQVSELKFWETSVVPQYGITGIPYNVLVDPKGNIIGQGLRGEGLHQTLDRVLR